MSNGLLGSFGPSLVRNVMPLLCFMLLFPFPETFASADHPKTFSHARKLAPNVFLSDIVSAAQASLHDLILDPEIPAVPFVNLQRRKQVLTPLRIPVNNFSNFSPHVIKDLSTPYPPIELSCPDSIPRTLFASPTMPFGYHHDLCLKHCLLPVEEVYECNCHLMFDSDQTRKFYLKRPDTLYYDPCNVYDETSISKFPQYKPSLSAHSAVFQPSSNINYVEISSRSPQFAGEWTPPLPTINSPAISVEVYLTDRVPMNRIIIKHIRNVSTYMFPLMIACALLIIDSKTDLFKNKHKSSRLPYLSVPISFAVFFYLWITSYFTASFAIAYSLAMISFLNVKVEEPEMFSLFVSLFSILFLNLFNYFNNVVLYHATLIAATMLIASATFGVHESRNHLVSSRIILLGISGLITVYCLVVHILASQSSQTIYMKYVAAFAYYLQNYWSSLTSSQFLFASAWNTAVNLTFFFIKEFNISHDAANLVVWLLAVINYFSPALFLLTIVTRRLNIYSDEYSNVNYLQKKFALACHFLQGLFLNFKGFYRHYTRELLNFSLALLTVLIMFFYMIDLLIIFSVISLIHYFYSFSPIDLFSYEYIVMEYENATGKYHSDYDDPNKILPFLIEDFTTILNSTVKILVPNKTGSADIGNGFRTREFLITANHIGQPSKTEIIDVNGVKTSITGKRTLTNFVPPPGSLLSQDSIVELSLRTLDKPNFAIPDASIADLEKADVLFGYSPTNRKLIQATKFHLDPDHNELFKFNSSTIPGDSGTPIFIPNPLRYVGTHSQGHQLEKGFSYGILNPSIVKTRLRSQSKSIDASESPTSKDSETSESRSDLRNRARPSKDSSASSKKPLPSSLTCYPLYEHSKSKPDESNFDLFVNSFQSLLANELNSISNSTLPLSLKCQFLSIQKELATIDPVRFSAPPSIIDANPTIQGSVRSIAKILSDHPAPSNPFDFKTFCEKFFLQRHYRQADFMTALNDSLKSHIFNPTS